MQTAPTDILAAKSSTRALRTYAYLTSSIQSQQGTTDAVECLMPFVLRGLQEQTEGEPVDDERLQQYLRSFGLSIPLFVLAHMKRRLADLGAVTWKDATECYVVARPRVEAESDEQTDPGLEQVFDSIEVELAQFAESLEIRGRHSPTWTDALISHFRAGSLTEQVEPPPAEEANAEAPTEPLTVRNVVVSDPGNVEAYVVGAFIEQCKLRRDQSTYQGIVQIYTGVLIEEFISSVQSTGQTTGFRTLSIYYDTTLLLRLLGTSGRTLEEAALEFHAMLQGLGCAIHYLPTTRQEVRRILNDMSQGKNIHWETSDALAAGDVDMRRIKTLANQWETELQRKEKFNITLEANVEVSGPFIKEGALRDELYGRAKGKSYTHKTATSDAKSVASIVRLRQGHTTHEVSDCRHLLISNNQLVQRTAKAFMLKQLDHNYEDYSVPPVMSVGQVATVAWLSQPQKLEPARVGKELLARCYNAVRPKPGWIKQYAAIIEDNLKEDPKYTDAIARDAMFAGTFTRLMRDATVGRPDLIDRVERADVVRLIAVAERTTKEIRDGLIAAQQAAEDARKELELVRQQQAEAALEASKAKAALSAAEEKRKAAEEQAQFIVALSQPPQEAPVVSLYEPAEPVTPVDDTREDKLRGILRDLDARMSTAAIYVMFGVFSLIAAAVLFGILQSTGALSFAVGSYVKEANFGGAFAGFLGTLVFLIRSLNSSVDKRLFITGNVMNADGSPVEGATVFVEGSERQRKTSAIGHFEIEVPDQAAWVVRAFLADAAASVTVAKGAAGKPVNLTLQNSRKRARPAKAATHQPP